ncbi:MAG: MFS transporter [Actinomycetota bacterium]|nr:MFS transporter [Actinomycetota bacterium]
MAAQAVRAFGYGLTSVLLGVTLDRLGFSGVAAGMVLTAVVAGTALASLALVRLAAQHGRRRCYVVLYVALGVSGIVFAFAHSAWTLAIVALAGALSTEVVESGPFTSLEQAMLAEELTGPSLAAGFGVYNAIATAAGSLGALAAVLPSATRRWIDVPAQRWFLLLVATAGAGVLIASRLTSRVEQHDNEPTPRRSGLGPSRKIVGRLSALFALDAFGGGFVVQSFVAFWLARRFDASAASVGVVFFAVGILQTASFLVAPILARRFGLLTTMVATHLPSNVLLFAIAFAPTFPVAVALWLARVAIGQMDVPTRQAYVMTLVEPAERVPAAAYTNTARYLVRPAGPALAGVAQSLALGAPFAIGGAIKGIYDVVLWRWFRRIPLRHDDALEVR